MAKLTNLNQATIPNADGPAQALKDFQSKTIISKSTFLILRIKLLRKSLKQILSSDVAWLTEGSVLKALSAKTGVSIIVQKEDFLDLIVRGRQNRAA